MVGKARERSTELNYKGSQFQDDIAAKVNELIKAKKHLNLIKSNDKKKKRPRQIFVNG